MNSCRFSPIYARVDVLLDKNKKLVLSELEVVEPELWFRFYNKGAKILAKKIASFINTN